MMKFRLEHQGAEWVIVAESGDTKIEIDYFKSKVEADLSLSILNNASNQAPGEPRRTENG